MVVNEKQVERLHEFTRQHYVEYYDLQLELVDHLANDIEEQWRLDSKLDFEKALEISFSKFGIFGFMDILDKRQNALSKTYFKLLWKEVLNWFKIPQIFTLVILFFSFYALSLLNNYVWIYAGLIVFLVIGSLVDLFIKRRTKSKAKTRKFILEEIIDGLGISLNILMFPYYFLQSFFAEGKLPEFMFSAYIYAFLMSLYVLIFYIVKYVLPSKKEGVLVEKYGAIYNS